MTIALVDADIAVFRAAAVVQEDFGNGPAADPAKAIDAFEHLIKEWLAPIRKPDVVMCVTSNLSFRKALGPYKENREGREKPLAFSAVFDHMRSNYEVRKIDGLEADDIMGIEGSADPSKVVITIDKDLMSVPCTLLNPMKMRKPLRIRKPVADRNWMIQTITGDSTDGYPGAVGTGIKGAEKIFANPHRLVKQTVKGKDKWIEGDPCDLWTSICDYYVKGGTDESDAIYNARMARILRAEDYNEETQEISLWHPRGSEKMSLTALTTTPLEESKSTTSSKPGNSHSQKATSSSTSSERPTKTKRSKTSRKPDGTSTSSSKRRKRKSASI